MRATIALVPPGSSVLVASVPIESRPWPFAGRTPYERSQPPHRVVSIGMFSYMHLAGLLRIERGAMWPYMFTDPSLQPVVTWPDWAGSDARRLACNCAPPVV